MNEQIEAIRNEIKRRMEKHWDLLPDADSPEDDWTHNELCELGAYKELERLETFVDSLPESNRPKLSDNSLEDEMINYWGRIPDDKDLIDTARHFALWQKEQMMNEWLQDRDGCFWDGVEEGKKAMEEQGQTKEGEVIEDGEFIKFSDGTYIDLCPDLSKESFAFKTGEKVIVQIRKA